MKNYKLAKGIIDKSDYLISDDNEYKDILEVLTKEDASALELKFYPIIPNVVNVLVAEFAKRNTKITFRGVDEYSHNEMLEEKRSQIEQVLMQKAEQKLMAKMIDQGMDPEDPEVQQQMQQQTSPEALKSLPEIQNFFDKSYKSLCEQWATHQFKIDEDRFRMDELEERGFRDMLITDREFWHMKMNEDDYDDLLDTIGNHDKKDYTSESERNDLLTVLSIADDLDAFGFTGIYRYSDIYLTRGISPYKLGHLILENAKNRFDNLEKTFDPRNAFVQKQKKRYEILGNFFLHYNKQAESYDFLKADPEGYCGLIQLFIMLIKYKMEFKDFFREAEIYRDDIIIGPFLNGLKSEFSSKYQYEQ